MLRVTTARRVAEIFWPDFFERNGMIFLPITNPSAWSAPRGKTLTEHERLQGHSHMQDLFRWHVPKRHDPEFDLEVPDPNSAEHAAAWELAQRIGQMWLAKLKHDFPSYRCRVYVSRLDDPVVHFHRVRAGEPVWALDEAANEDFIILDSSPAGARRNEPRIVRRR